MKYSIFSFSVFLLLFSGCFPTAPAETMEEELPELKNSEWTLIRPNDLSGTLKVDEEAMKISGFNGCNQYTADIILKNYQLEFDKFTTTKRYCEDLVEDEKEFMFLLSKAKDYRLSKTRLYLNDYSGTLMVFERKEE